MDDFRNAQSFIGSLVVTGEMCQCLRGLSIMHSVTSELPLDDLKTSKVNYKFATSRSYIKDLPLGVWSLTCILIGNCFNFSITRQRLKAALMESPLWLPEGKELVAWKSVLDMGRQILRSLSVTVKSVGRREKSWLLWDYFKWCGPKSAVPNKIQLTILI